MANNSEKLWIQRRLNDTAIQRAQQAIQSTGRALPCSVVAVNGSLVTVKFEVDSTPWTLPQITIPKAESQWVRMPTQVGDMGLTIPGDVSLAGVTGMGGGIANLARRGNLSTLVFLPLSNKNLPPVNQNAAYIAGPDGVILQDEAGSAVMNVGGGQVGIKGNVMVQGNLGASTGASGVVTTMTGQTLTFVNGILVNIF